jgi:hypothetical protein
MNEFIVAINTLDKMRNFTVRADGGAAYVCDQTPTVIYTCSDLIVTGGTYRFQNQKDIIFIIFEVLTARSALIPNTYEPYPKSRGPEFMKCLESSLFSGTCGWWKHINISNMSANAHLYNKTLI